jgi:hypothetical protein
MRQKSPPSCAGDCARQRDIDRRQQKVGQKRNISDRRGRFSHQRFQPVQLHLRRILALETLCTLELIDDGEQRTILVMRRAEIVQAGVLFLIELVCQRNCEARFYRSRLRRRSG